MTLREGFVDLYHGGAKWQIAPNPKEVRKGAGGVKNTALPQGGVSMVYPTRSLKNTEEEIVHILPLDVLPHIDGKATRVALKRPAT